jgi:hypothetical protein
MPRYTYTTGQTVYLAKTVTEYDLFDHGISRFPGYKKEKIFGTVEDSTPHGIDNEILVLWNVNTKPTWVRERALTGTPPKGSIFNMDNARAGDRVKLRPDAILKRQLDFGVPPGTELHAACGTITEVWAITIRQILLIWDNDPTSSVRTIAANSLRLLSKEELEAEAKKAAAAADLHPSTMPPEFTPPPRP